MGNHQNFIRWKKSIFKKTNPKSKQCKNYILERVRFDPTAHLPQQNQNITERWGLSTPSLAKLCYFISCPDEVLKTASDVLLQLIPPPGSRTFYHRILLQAAHTSSCITNRVADHQAKIGPQTWAGGESACLVICMTCSPKMPVLLMEGPHRRTTSVFCYFSFHSWPMLLGSWNSSTGTLVVYFFCLHLLFN